MSIPTYNESVYSFALINHGNGSCDGFSPNFPELSDPVETYAPWNRAAFLFNFRKNRTFLNAHKKLQ